MAKYLSKEEELHLGELIQNMMKAKDQKNLLSLTMEGSTPAEDREYENTIKLGVKAVETLVEANVDLVRSRAQIFKSRYPGAPEIDDLIQEGMTGLMTAVYKYDPTKGNKFSTVAYYWIVQAIGRGTNKTGRLVRLPENRVSDFISISRVRSAYEESGLSATEINHRVMEKTGLSFAEITDISNAASTPASLNKVVNSGDDSSRELMDYVGEDHVTESSEDLVMKTELFTILQEQLEEMSEVARDVVAASFMMESLASKDLTGAGAEGLSSKNVREKHKLSAPRFKKILNESLVTIHARLDNLGVKFEDFLD